MQLMRLSETTVGERDLVFRYSQWHASIGFLVIACVSAGLILFGWQRGSLLTGYIAGVVLLVALVFQRTLLARFRPTNWLVRMNDDGIIVKFRSYLNYHFDDQYPGVVVIPYREIRSARYLRLNRESAVKHDSASERSVRSLVEIEVAGETKTLAVALAAERNHSAPQEARWYGRASVFYRHYPVRVAPPDRVQIEWGVIPGVETFLRHLGRHTDVTPPAHLLKEYVNLTSLTPAQQAERLLDVALEGRTIEAIEIARRLYSLDLTQAKSFVDNLLAKQAIKD